MAICAVDLVAGDTGSLHGPVTCVDKAGAIINLTGATVLLKYKITLNGVEGSEQVKTMTINAPATAGIAQYQFLAGELTEGIQKGFVHVTDSGGFINSELCKFTKTIRAA